MPPASRHVPRDVYNARGADHSDGALRPRRLARLRQLGQTPPSLLGRAVRGAGIYTVY